MNFRHTFFPLFSIETEIAIGVFAAVSVALLFAVVRYRRRDGRPVWKTHKNTPLEIGYALAVAAVAGFLIVRTATANAVQQRIPGPVATTVTATGSQWCWRFSYQDAPATVTGDCIDGAYPTLVLPTDRKIEVLLTSTDVLHAFWVPFLRYKLYAYPGHVNKFVTRLSRTGRWRGLCAEFCGLHHDTMDFWVQAVTPAQFDSWVHSGGTAPPR